MRSAVIGAACAWDADFTRLFDLTHRATTLTHTDPKAHHGALMVAGAAACFARNETKAGAVLRRVTDILPASGTDELRERLAQVADSLTANETTEAFAARHFPGGVSGYVNATVPVVLHAALSYPGNLRRAVMSVIACGGDTDTVAAITGGIVGANVGVTGIPDDLRRGIWEPTGTLTQIEKHTETFAHGWVCGKPCGVPTAHYLSMLARNTVFAGIVLAHGFRRLAPPY